MKRFYGALILALIAVGCGKDSPTGPDVNSGIIFKLDANTCAGINSLTVQLYIDGTLVGTETMSAGTSSKVYFATAGSHVTSARVANINYAWSNINVTVQKNAVFTTVLLCT